MKKIRRVVCGIVAVLGFAAASHAQPPGITREMIASALPVEGAPLAVPGPYKTLSEPAFNSPGHVIFRPADLSAFPAKDTLPVMAWGNGGCAINSTRYGGFLSTIASHGFLVIATAAKEGEKPRQSNADDLRAALNWAEAETSVTARRSKARSPSIEWPSWVSPVAASCRWPSASIRASTPSACSTPAFSPRTRTHRRSVPDR